MLVFVCLTVLLLSSVQSAPQIGAGETDPPPEENLMDKIDLDDPELVAAAEAEMGRNATEEERDLFAKLVGNETCNAPRRGRTFSVNYLWPSTSIPVFIPANYYTNTQLNVIFQAMIAIQSSSCIRFRSATSSDVGGYMRFTSDDFGCYVDVVGFVGYHYNKRGYSGAHWINLNRAEGCVSRGVVIHEILHSLGFIHEHQRPDRNQYIRVNYGNIQSKAYSQFQLSYNNYWDNGLGYDYYSIMHYGPYLFSNGRGPSFTPTNNVNANDIGRQVQMSNKDVNKLNAAYC